MTDYIVSIDNSPHIKVQAINLFLAAAGAVRRSGARDIKTIVVKPHGVKLSPTTFNINNIQNLGDELFRLSPLAEGFEVEETNREGDTFYFIDPESNVIELTLDGRAVRQTE